jgi:F-type H+-transporting ATPase subunit b
MSLAMIASEDFVLFQWQPGVMIWTAVIFAVSLPFMYKFVFGPIIRNLDARDKKVEDAARAAEDAKIAAERAVADAEASRQEAMAEARQAKDAAMARIEREVAEERAAAKAEAEREREKARSEIEAAKRRALAEIRQEVVNLTISSTSKILRQDIDDDAHRRLVEDFLGPQN